MVDWLSLKMRTGDSLAVGMDLYQESCPDLAQ